MEIHQMICLSTGHLSEATRALFEARADALPLFFAKDASDGTRYGYFVPIGIETIDEPLHDCPTDLMVALTFAQKQGAGWIMFDIDGPVVEGLDYFDVEEVVSDRFERAARAAGWITIDEAGWDGNLICHEDDANQRDGREYGGTWEDVCRAENIAVAQR